MIIHEEKSGLTVTTIPLFTAMGQKHAALYVTSDTTSGNARNQLPIWNCSVQFQIGDPKDVGVNGFTNESLLAILIHRTKDLLEKKPCDENTLALGYIKLALECFKSRQRAVELLKETSNRSSEDLEVKLK